MQHAMSVAYAIFLPSALARPVEQRKIGIVVGYEALTPAVGGIQPTLEQAPCNIHSDAIMISMRKLMWMA